MGISYLKTLEKPFRLPGLHMERSIAVVHALTSIEGATSDPELQKKGPWPWIEDDVFSEILKTGTKTNIDRLYPIVEKMLDHARTEYFSWVSTTNFWVSFWENRGQKIKDADSINANLKSLEFSQKIVPQMDLTDLLNSKNIIKPSEVVLEFERVLDTKIESKTLSFETLSKLNGDNRTLSKALLHKSLRKYKNLGTLMDLSNCPLSLSIARHYYPRLDMKDFKQLESLLSSPEVASKILEKTNMIHQQAVSTQGASFFSKESHFPSNWNSLKLPHKVYWIYHSFQSKNVSKETLLAMLREKISFPGADYVFNGVIQANNKELMSLLFYLAKNNYPQSTFSSICLTTDPQNIPSLYLSLCIKEHLRMKKRTADETERALWSSRLKALEERAKLENKFHGKTKLRLVLK